MTAQWFTVHFPPSRFAIEGELRSNFWRAGYGHIWFTCTQDEPPYACLGTLDGDEFNIEWEPKTYLLLKTKEPNPRLLQAMERVLGHRALAAYRNGDGSVVVEWRAKNADQRFDELGASGVQDLERLNK